MFYIEFAAETSLRARVTFIHSMPFDPVNGLHKSEEELLKTGLLVDQITEATPQPGKTAQTYINPTTKEMWVEYTEIPAEPVSDVGALKELVEQQKAALTDAHDAIAYLSEEIIALRAEVTALKGGEA